MADAVPTPDAGSGEVPPSIVSVESLPQENQPKVDAAQVQDGGKGEAPPATDTENVQKDANAKIEAEVIQKPIEESKEASNEKNKEVESVPKEISDPEPNPASVPADLTEESTLNLIDKENWDKREQDLLRIIEELRDKAKNEKSEDALKMELKVREEQIDLLKTRVTNLETKLEAVLSKPSGKNHEMIENIKQQHEDLLTKARGMIFDKTKMVKNQELQIEALTSQVQSLKDVNVITKYLLDIRNSEVKAMEERLQVMEARFKAEKERYDLVLKRAQTSTNINDDLRKEYETQLAIFKELREKYEQRVQALVAENNRLKGNTAGSSA